MNKFLGTKFGKLIAFMIVTLLGAITFYFLGARVETVFQFVWGFWLIGAIAYGFDTLVN